MKKNSWILILIDLLPFIPSDPLWAAELHSAAGVSGAFQTRESTSEYSFAQFAPELVLHGYSQLDSEFWLRPSLRISYAWTQPQMPYSIQLREYDLKAVAEMGVVWSWVVMPSFSIGLGGIFRQTDRVTAPPLGDSESHVSKSSFLPLLQTQLGVGIPIEKGWIVIEPYVRHLLIFGDSRYHWGYGTEVTLALF